MVNGFAVQIQARGVDENVLDRILEGIRPLRA